MTAALYLPPSLCATVQAVRGLLVSDALGCQLHIGFSNGTNTHGCQTPGDE
jgi:hypothetical protein